MFNPEWLKLRADQLSVHADRIPWWLLDTDAPAEPWQQHHRAMALAWWLVDYDMAPALNPALEQARTILGVPL